MFTFQFLPSPLQAYWSLHEGFRLAHDQQQYMLG